MLESLYFDVVRGGVHSEMNVTVKDGKVYHTARLYGGWPVPGLDKDEAYPYSTEWLMRIHRLNLPGLEHHYSSDRPEDVTWTVEGVDNGTPFRSSGTGAYPPGWDELLLLADELAPEACFIDPDLIEHVLMRYSDVEDTEFGPHEYTEELSMDRRSQKLIYRRSFSKDIYVQTEYRNMNEISIGLDMWDNLFGGFSAVSMDDMAPEEPARLNVTVDRHDGSQEKYLWHYNRTCLPDNWSQFIGLIGHRFQMGAMFVNMISPAIYMHGAKAGELIYCTVRIPALGHCYYYLTNDNSLMQGDKVLVPYGKDNEILSGEIKKIEYFLPENVPHPVTELKPIIGRDFDPDDEIKK